MNAAPGLRQRPESSRLRSPAKAQHPCQGPTWIFLPVDKFRPFLRGFRRDRSPVHLHRSPIRCMFTTLPRCGSAGAPSCGADQVPVSKKKDHGARPWSGQSRGRTTSARRAVQVSQAGQRASWKGVSFWNSAAMRSTSASPRRMPAICSPMGKPWRSRPAGTDTPQRWSRLKMRV